MVQKDMPRNNFDFFRIFEELFDYYGATSVSTTPAKQALPVSLRTVRNSSPVLLTPVNYAFTVLECFTGVNDPAEELNHQCQYLTSPVSGT